MNKEHEVALLNDPAYDEALAFARKAHDGQLRDFSKEPYVNHCIRVAAECYALGMKSNVVMAALFHDLLEDTSITREDIASQWGEPVADMVVRLTCPSKLKSNCNAFKGVSKDIIQQAYRDQIAASKAPVHTIKLMDIKDNTADMWRFAHLNLERAERFSANKWKMFAILTKSYYPQWKQTRRWLKELDNVIAKEKERINKINSK